MVTQLFVQNIESITDMVKNIFCPLPNVNRGGALAVTETLVEEEGVLRRRTLAWSYMVSHKLIYEIFLQLVINEAWDVKALIQFVTSNLISEFLQLFDSYLVGERDF